MATWQILKKSISDAINTNGNQEITGAVLQGTLKNIVNALGENATFAGVATPSSNPGTPDGRVFYVASQPGDYSNFTQATIKDGEISFFLWDGNQWENIHILKDFIVSTDKIEDRSVTSDKIKNLAVTNEKIANDAITSIKISVGAVTNEKIADGAISQTKYGEKSIFGFIHIADRSITGLNFSTGCVDSNAISERAVTPVKLYRDFGQSSYVGQTPIEIDTIEDTVTKIYTQSFHFSIDDINIAPYEYLLSQVTGLRASNGDMLISAKGCYIGYDNSSSKIVLTRGLYDNSCCQYITSIGDYVFSPVLQDIEDKGVTKLQGVIIIEYAVANKIH